MKDCDEWLCLTYWSVVCSYLRRTVVYKRMNNFGRMANALKEIDTPPRKVSLQKKSDKNDGKGDKSEKVTDKNDEKVDKYEKKSDKNDGKGDKSEKKSDKNDEKVDKAEKKSDKKDVKGDKSENKSDKNDGKGDKSEGKSEEEDKNLKTHHTRCPECGGNVQPWRTTGESKFTFTRPCP